MLLCVSVGLSVCLSVCCIICFFAVFPKLGSPTNPCLTTQMDGVSMEIFVKDLQTAYDGGVFPTDVLQYPDFSIRESEQARHGRWKTELDYWKHNEFAKVPEPLPLLPLSEKSMRPDGVVPYGILRVERWLSPDLSSLVKATAQRLRSGVFAFYLAVLQAVIVRFIKVDEFCVGLADANRRDGDVLESIGLYLALLPLRVGGSPSRRFADAVRDMHTKSRAAFAHAGVPFDVLLQELGVARSASHAPLFQVFMSYRPGVNEMRELCGCDGEGEFLGGGELAYDISLDVVENPNANKGTHVMLSVQESLYGQPAARVLLDVFCNLLEAFALNPSTRISSPALYTQPQLDQALDLGRGATQDYAWPPTLAHRIQDVVRSHPHRLCLSDGGSVQLTYSQMGRVADRIVEEMKDLLEGVRKAGLPADTDSTHDIANRPGRVVAVLQDPTPASICSLYAILKSGRAYVPLDPLVGAARLRAIAAESQPSCILVDDNTESLVPGIVLANGGPLSGHGIPVINVTRLMDQSMTPGCGTRRSGLQEDGGTGSEPHLVAAQPTDLAAVLYTSGSTTGKPKGICLSHLSLRNNMEISSRQFLIPDHAGDSHATAALAGSALVCTEVDPPDRGEEGVVVVMQQTAPSFDMSLCQVFCALCNGGSLVVAPAHVRRDPGLLARLMRDTGVTHTLATPAEYASLVRHGASDLAGCGSWRSAVSGGDKLTERVVEGFRSLANRGLRLVNAYGPAEVTFACASAEVPYHDGRHEDGRQVVVSSKRPPPPPAPAPLKTFPNYAVCIMGEDMKPVPLGVPGEVCVSGAGVGSLGYLHDPVLTADKFLPHGNPLAPDTTSTFASQGWTTLHRTGDRGKLVEVNGAEVDSGGGVVGVGSGSSIRGGLVLLGRMHGDSQMKVRGIRIDAQEVEDALTQCEDAWSRISVAQAGVSVRTDDKSGTDFLVAHVVLDMPEHVRNGDGNVEVARAAGTARFLRELPGLPSTLAAYMRPSAVLPVPSLPLTPSKKLDRQALRSLPVYCRWEEGDNVTTITVRHTHSAPVPATSGEGPGEVLTPAHEAIKQLWERVIPGSLVHRSVNDGDGGVGGGGLDGVVGPRTDFFHVGGTSLLLVELHSLLKEMLGPSSPELPSVQQLFQSSTLGGMARLLKGTTLARFAPTLGHDTHIGPSDQDMDQDYPARALSSPRTTPFTDQKQRTAADWEKEAGLLSHARYGKAQYHQQEQEQEQEQTPAPIEGPIEHNSERSSEQAGSLAGQEVRVRVVLTGATGFLGNHILETLLEDPVIDRVYAVAVRLQERPGGPPRELPPVFHDRRVEVYFGDLSAPNLGLSQSLVERIFSTADAVVHNGADVSFLKSYESLRPANVDATKQLALWAVQYGHGGRRQGRRRRSQGIPFHFVSSASVAQLAQGGMADHDAMREACEASLAGHPPTASTDGYVAAKWVAERHLEQVAASYGLPVTIHRPPSIARRGGEDDHDDNNSCGGGGGRGSSNNQNNDLMANMFKFAERLQALPDFGQHVLPGSVLHLVSAEFVAGTIVRHAVGSYHDIESCSENGASIEGPASPRVRYLYEGCREGAIALSATTGGDPAGLGLLPWGEWLGRAEAEGMNPLLAEYLRKTVALGSLEARDCADTRPSAFSQQPQPALARC
jgi:hybrid polyketide synthase / nonribosomal peptide synthetase ACE1